MSTMLEKLQRFQAVSGFHGSRVEISTRRSSRRCVRQLAPPAGQPRECRILAEGGAPRAKAKAMNEGNQCMKFP